MKRTGNAVADKTHNPRNVKPAIPIDVDEVDSAMERFIRQKYESKILEYGKPKPPSREDPSYISKPGYDAPPPLPPKPGRKFGFGLRTSSRSNKPSSAGSSVDDVESPGSQYANKQSRTLGLTLNDGNGSLESKLAILRDMGFPDPSRNATILKGFDGDLDKSVEALVRLGEGNGGANSGSRTPASNRTTPGKVSDSADSLSSTAASSTNPFDKLDSAPPRPAVGLSVDTAQPQVTTAANGGDNQAGQSKTSYNPFDAMSSHPAASSSQLDQPFQNLQVSQPLFPNTTGGYPSQQQQMPFSRYQHSMTPPAKSAFNAGFVSSPSPIDGNHNPFFPPAGAATSGVPSSQPQTISPNNPFFGQFPTQNAPVQPNMQNPQPMNAPPSTNNPYVPQHANTMPAYSAASSYFQPHPQPPPPQQQQQPYQLQQPTNNPYSTAPTASANKAFQQPSRMDKSSILALYNFSQPPPTIPEQPQQQPPPPGQSQTEVTPQQLNQPQQPPSQSYYPVQQPPQASPSNPAPAQSEPTYQSRNPFGVPGSGTNVTVNQGSNPPAAPALSTKGSAPFSRTHTSQESIDVENNQSGRHSPDIFSSLSARHG